MKLSNKDKKEVQIRYTNRFNEYGYSPKSLGWDKGKQDIRFEILTSQYNFQNKSVLDIGCGFGDLNKTLSKKFKSYDYTGIDIVDVLINKGKELYKTPKKKFIVGDFLEHKFDHKFDYAVASGIFNFRLLDGNNLKYIESVIRKSLEVCKDGLAFDFLSDKVDFKYGHTFHSNPEEILGLAYKYSRNLILRNDYMPFEFSLFIFKDESFEKTDTVFNRYHKLKVTSQSKK
ncbi:MAG: class I SAM-dependent methyltransferase [Bacteroidia bacterium]